MEKSWEKFCLSIRMSHLMEKQGYRSVRAAQSRGSEPFGAARAACFEHPAGVSAGCGAAWRIYFRLWRESNWELGGYVFIPSAKSAPLENVIN